MHSWTLLSGAHKLLVTISRAHVVRSNLPWAVHTVYTTCINIAMAILDCSTHNYKGLALSFSPPPSTRENTFWRHHPLSFASGCLEMAIKEEICHLHTYTTNLTTQPCPQADCSMLGTRLPSSTYYRPMMYYKPTPSSPWSSCIGIGRLYRPRVIRI